MEKVNTMKENDLIIRNSKLYVIYTK